MMLKVTRKNSLGHPILLNDTGYNAITLAAIARAEAVTVLLETIGTLPATQSILFEKLSEVPYR